MRYTPRAGHSLLGRYDSAVARATLSNLVGSPLLVTYLVRLNCLLTASNNCTLGDTLRSLALGRYDTQVLRKPIDSNNSKLRASSGTTPSNLVRRRTPSNLFS